MTCRIYCRLISGIKLHPKVQFMSDLDEQVCALGDGGQAEHPASPDGWSKSRLEKASK
jgi:hypothetical protein